MSEELTFSIGHDSNITVRSWDELLEWLKEEHSRWDWLVGGEVLTDREQVATKIQIAWQNVVSEITQLYNQGQSLNQALSPLSALTSGHILISTTPDGTTVLDILESSGKLPASFAAGFIKSMYGLNAVKTPADLLGAMLCAIPGIDNPANLSHLSDRLKRERANFKNAARSLTELVEQEAIVRNENNAKLVRRLLAVARRKFIFKRAKWVAAQEAMQLSADDAVAQITETDNTFKEFMKLKAPAQYWTDKAAEHKDKEDIARTKLYWFFPLTLVISGAVFVCTANFLLKHPDTAGSKAPIALYVVISGGLLLVSTLAFWVGRLLTKLYLSEHHLRNDAEERSVMATTYLALSHEGTALETDRQIILSALFRATPDGIVKDDGPSDTGLQAFIARQLTK